MKTIELNTTTSMIVALMIAGIGSIFPVFYPGYVPAFILLISAVALIKAYKSKIWYKINNRE